MKNIHFESVFISKSTHSQFGSRPVNLHPLCLLWKHGSVCDPEKNRVQNMGWQKQDAKNQVWTFFCYSKLLLFLNNKKRTRPSFFHPVFFTPYFGPYFFQVCKLTHVFKTIIVGADWLGEYVIIFLDDSTSWF